MGLRPTRTWPYHSGPSCTNCGAGWDREQVVGRKTCPHCKYPFREYQTPLHTGEEHTIEDYVDAEALDQTEAAAVDADIDS